MDFAKHKEFIPAVAEFKALGVNLIGYFPYEVASLKNSEASIFLPMEMFADLHHALYSIGALSNKCVYLLQNREMGDNHIAMQYHDNRFRFGTWDDIVRYNQVRLKIEG